MAKTMGRPTIFVGKKAEIHGRLTAEGSALFEAKRKRLAQIAAVDVTKASDGDTVEFTVRGERATRVYLKKRRP